MAKLAVELEVIDKGKAVITGFSTNLEQQMKKSQRNVDSFGTSFAAVAGRIAGPAAAIAATSAAWAAGITALVTSSAQHVREMTNLAQLAGASVQDFSAFAFATEEVGIDAEKLADISKDVKDKLGDFIATGGGEFKDFFENVAPKVGLTAQELQKLSGPEVLIAVKKAMDDANVSYEEQVFYLEAIGNDASKLIPLLANNGEEMRRNAERAKELGVALDNVDNQKLIEAEQSSRELGTAFEGLKTRLAVEFAPAFESVVGNLADGIAWLNESLEKLSIKRPILELREELGSINSQILHAEKGLFGFGLVGTKGADEIAKLKSQRDALMVQIRDAESGATRKQANEALEAKNAPEAYVPKPPPGGGGGSGGGGNTAPSILTDQYEKLDGALKKYFSDLDQVAEKEAQRTAALRESMEATDRHILALNGIQNAKDAPETGWEGALSRRESALKEHNEAMKEENDKTFFDMKGAMTGWASSWSGTLTDMLFEAEGTFADIAESFLRMVAQTGIQKGIEFGISSLFNVSAAAQGAVFSGPGISTHRNSIVNRPTIFPFAQGIGLMGEAGSEAIMPLTRMSGGDLGVKVSGGGSVTNINIINNTNGSVSTTERSNGQGGVDIDVLIDNAVASNINRFGSMTNKAMRANTNSSAQLIRR